MSDWRWGRLGELATGIRGVSYRPDQLREFPSRETVALLRSNNIQDGALHFDDVQYVPAVIVDQRQLLKEGDLAVCMSNGSRALVGKAGAFDLRTRSHTVGAFCSVFRPTAGACHRFVSHIFQSEGYRKHLNLTLAGSAINNLRNRDLELFSVPIPPTAEQSLVAHILDTLDTQIRRTEELIAKLEQIKQGLLTDLLTRGIDENGDLRPPPEEAPHLYKESPLGQIPRTWEVSFLAEKAKPGIPHIRTGPFGSALKGEHWVREGHPVITIGSLGEGDFDRSELLFVRPQDANRLAVFQLELGDVVFSRVADVGRSVAISGAEVGWIMSSNLMRISLDRSKIVPEFLQLQLGSEMAKRQVRANVNAGGRDVANSAIMNQLRFFWPEYREQERICRRMSAAKAVSTAHLRELSSLRHLKAGLMDDLLTGRVRVTPLLDKSAQATG